MKFKNALLSSVFLMLTLCLAAQPVVTGLTTDYKMNPLGIDNPKPEFSWIITSGEHNTMQDSYEIRAALDPSDLAKGRKLIWETGKVSSSQSTHISYNGKPLESFQRVYWQVRVTDNHGKRSKWSEPAFLETAFLPGTDWKARWVGPAWEENHRKSMPSPFLRGTFNMEKQVERARLYISCQGLYRAEINGKPVGDQVLTPGWTSYHHRIQYQTFNVKDQLVRGENALGIILGDGWFRGYLGWQDNRNVWGDELAAIAQLEITYSDGTSATVITDGSWKASTGPILESDIYNGEIYDARKELGNWSSPGYDDDDWTPVKIADPPSARLIAPEGPPVRVIKELTPVSIEKYGDGWLVDMGQNMVGWIRIKATGSSGDVITLRHAEVLDKEGKIYFENLRAAKATDIYTLKGGGEEIFEPHFTWQGFRFVQVEGYPGELTPDKITGRVIHSDMEPAGTFECSDSMINQLQHNIVWGLKGNFLDVPTDCPQRDERLGWTGDAQVFSPTACFNMNAATFYKKWLKDLAADQDPDGRIPDVIPNLLRGGGRTGWADAGVIIPWVVYLNYGDVDVLKDQYESMKAWIGFMEQHAGDDYIWQENDYHYGDWLSFDDSRSDYMGAYTTKDLIATAYFSYSSGIVGRVAGILGYDQDAQYYSELSNKIKKAFNQEYVTPNGRLVAHTQTAYTLALAFDMLDPETAAKAASFLAKDVEQFGHITTGFLGTPLISLILTETGRNDLAYMLLNRKEYPSWLYPVTMGATTIWERWDGQKPDSTFQDPGMNSFNHYAYGAIGNWMYKVVAGIGIDEDNPGYRRIIIRPRPGGGLTYAKASHKSLYGTVGSEWELNGSSMKMKVTVPVNTSATVYIPGGPDQITIDGNSLEDTGIDYQLDGNTVKAELGSGTWTLITTAEP